MDIQIQTRKNVFWLSFKRLGEEWKKSYRQNDFPAKMNSLQFSLFFPSLSTQFQPKSSWNLSALKFEMRLKNWADILSKIHEILNYEL